MAGGLFLLIDGQYIYFNYPEWLAVCVVRIGVCLSESRSVPGKSTGESALGFPPLQL
jgi:hypothetical protein